MLPVDVSLVEGGSRHVLLQASEDQTTLDIYPILLRKVGIDELGDDPEFVCFSASRTDCRRYCIVHLDALKKRAEALGDYDSPLLIMQGDPSAMLYLIPIEHQQQPLAFISSRQHQVSLHSWQEISQGLQENMHHEQMSTKFSVDFVGLKTMDQKGHLQIDVGS